MSDLATTDDTVYTECTRCGQDLFIHAPGRNICERCRLGRTVFPETDEAKAARIAAIPPVPERPLCTGCGRNKTDQGYVLGLAEGICLSCRVLASQAGK